MSDLDGRPVLITFVTNETIRCKLIRVLSDAGRTDGILHVKLHDDDPAITNLYERHVVSLTYLDGRPGNYYASEGELA